MSDIWGDIKIVVVIDRNIRMCYLYFIYTPGFTVSLVLDEGELSYESCISYPLHKAQAPSGPSYSTV